MFWSSRILADVSVAWSSDSPDCAGTAVRNPRSKSPVIEAQEGMRCRITVQVTNHSSRDVHLGDAVAPFVGPHTGAVVRAENAEPADRGSPYRIDARLRLDRDLPAGTTTTFQIVLVFHPAGCNDSGTMRVPNWPAVSVSALGRSREVHGDAVFAFHRDGATPGCRKLSASGSRM